MDHPDRIVVDGCAIATMDADGREFAAGHVAIERGRIAAVDAGPPSLALLQGARRMHRPGMLLTPGLVNGHHHMFQSLTRGLAQQSNLFSWLTALYPTWVHLDEDLQRAATGGAVASLLLSGCTTTTDHHYLHPPGSGDLLAAGIDVALELGIRFHPCRGSMDLGRSDGGLPPDHVVEDIDGVLEATDDAISRFHDPAPGAMLRIAVAPCAPFTVSDRLMRESANLARARGVRLHTHLAETVEEDAFCAQRHGCRPVDYLAERGWLGDDVWLAHCVHLAADEVARFGATGTSICHCPSSNARLGAGIAPVADLLAAGVAVSLGVDGSASNEAAEMLLEVRQAMLMSRLRDGEAAMGAREALALGTTHGARCLGRADELGSIRVGGLADLVTWDLSGLAHAGIEDPVAALVFGPPRAAHDVVVNGRMVVESGELRTGDVDTITRELTDASRRLARLASGTGTAVR